MPTVKRGREWPTSPHPQYEGPPPMAVDDPRYPIFSQRYLVRVKWQETRSVEDIREYGVSHTGIDQFDKQVANEERVVMLTIADLTELHKSGCRIGVVNGPDTRKIYEAISRYLEIWKEKITKSLNRREAPNNDLIALDAFAHAVYERAKWHFDENFISLHMNVIRNAGVRQDLRSLIKVKDKPSEEWMPKGLTIVKPKPAKSAPLPQVDLDNLPTEEDPFKARESYIDVFKPKTNPNSLNTQSATLPDPEPTHRTSTTNPAIERLLGNLGSNKRN